LTLITGGTDVTADAAGAVLVSVMIGTKVGSGSTAGSTGFAARSQRASRRHVKN
jgi:hypothetical protein